MVLSYFSHFQLSVNIDGVELHHACNDKYRVVVCLHLIRGMSNNSKRTVNNIFLLKNHFNCDKHFLSKN